MKKGKLIHVQGLECTLHHDFGASLAAGCKVYNVTWPASTIVYLLLYRAMDQALLFHATWYQHNKVQQSRMVTTWSSSRISCLPDNIDSLSACWTRRPTPAHNFMLMQCCEWSVAKDRAIDRWKLLSSYSVTMALITTAKLWLLVRQLHCTLGSQYDTQTFISYDDAEICIFARGPLWESNDRVASWHQGGEFWHWCSHLLTTINDDRMTHGTWCTNMTIAVLKWNGHAPDIVIRWVTHSDICECHPE